MKPGKHAHANRAPRSFIARQDLNETSRALYGLAQAYEAEAAELDHESVEDPLQDWPQSDLRAWLDERGGSVDL